MTFNVNLSRSHYDTNSTHKDKITAVRLGHMKNALVGVVYIAIMKPTSAFFIWPSLTPVKMINACDGYVAYSSLHKAITDCSSTHVFSSMRQYLSFWNF